MNSDHAQRMAAMNRHRMGVRAALAVTALAVPFGAQASFLPPEVMDKAAMYLAWFIIVVVPIGAIILFWLVHILPEKIAHKRHHPQRDAIQTLCLLSLVFGGLLWPIAWLWAYTKPAGYRLAYGTDKHEDYFRELAERLNAGELTDVEIGQLRAELETMADRGSLTPELRQLRLQLIAKQAAAPATVTVPVVAPVPPPATRTAGGSA